MIDRDNHKIIMHKGEPVAVVIPYDDYLLFLDWLTDQTGQTPNINTQTKHVTVSVSKHDLDMIDRKAKQAGMTRSDFLTAAASAYDVRDSL